MDQTSTQFFTPGLIGAIGSIGSIGKSLKKAFGGLFGKKKKKKKKKKLLRLQQEQERLAAEAAARAIPPAPATTPAPVSTIPTSTPPGDVSSQLGGGAYGEFPTYQNAQVEPPAEYETVEYVDSPQTNESSEQVVYTEDNIRNTTPQPGQPAESGFPY